LRRREESNRGERFRLREDRKKELAREYLTEIVFFTILKEGGGENCDRERGVMAGGESGEVLLGKGVNYLTEDLL